MLLGPKASQLQRVLEWVLIPNQTSSFWWGPVQLFGLIPAEGASLASLECFKFVWGIHISLDALVEDNPNLC